jgi:nicotinic acid mononucleotide adenylyltransferase
MTTVKQIDFSKVEKQMKNIKGKIPTILILGGSFNPVHQMHIHSFIVAKNHIDSLNKEYVIGGFLIPSTDRYVQGKLGEEAIPLKLRNKMIDLAVEKSDFILNCPWGVSQEFSAGVKIQKIIMDLFPNELQFLNLRTLGGADYTVKRRLWKDGTCVAIARGSDTKEIQLNKSNWHKDFILIEDESLKDLSSTKIRKILKDEEKFDSSDIAEEVSDFIYQNSEILFKF